MSELMRANELPRETVEPIAASARVRPLRPVASPASWLVLGVTLLVFAWYWPTTWSMVLKWYTNETYAHGLVVVPLFLWLIWRSRLRLASVELRPAWWAVPVTAAMGLLWLVGELAYVVSVGQVAVVSMIVLGVIAVGGTQLARALVFPLVFLFFAVPFGDDLLPYLMNWTADFAVFALRATGVPVYKEGLHFVIPTGHWSVVEACSGIRYLIASLMVGVLYAYLTYRSWRRRLLFVALSAAVPILANGLRAYMIVMIGHLSGNKYGAGVDHLIYGWVFFGLVMVLMFWIGSFFREDATEGIRSNVTAPVAAPATSLRSPASMVAICLTLVAILPWRVMPGLFESSQPVAAAFVGRIPAQTDWSAGEPPADWMPSFKYATSIAAQGLAKGDARVGLVIAYYSRQRQGEEMISWENKIVSSHDARWPVLKTGARRVEIDGETRRLRETEIGTQGERLLVWQWYWVGGHVAASEHEAKALLAWNKLRGHGDNSAAIFVFAPVSGDRRRIEAVLAEFMQGHAATIGAALTATSANVGD